MRYFFNVKDGDRVAKDSEGSELADSVAAKMEARMIARDMMIECMKEGRKLDGQQIEIADERGDVVETLRVRDVVSAA
jgi:hypothetical protein